MKYKALKDVPYWGIKAGEVYHINISGSLIVHEHRLTRQPLLEAGIIEEYEPRKPLTKGNIKNEEWYYWFALTNNDCMLNNFWDGGTFDLQLSRAPIFRPDEKMIATECYKAMCDFGFQWVKENYSKYH